MTDLVGVADIARRCGVSKPTVYAWREREGFPAPVLTKGGALWRWEDVAAWTPRRAAATAGDEYVDSLVDSIRSHRNRYRVLLAKREKR